MTCEEMQLVQHAFAQLCSEDFPSTLSDAEPTSVNRLETHCSDAGLLAFGGMTMAPLLER